MKTVKVIKLVINGHVAATYNVPEMLEVSTDYEEIQSMKDDFSGWVEAYLI